MPPSTPPLTHTHLTSHLSSSGAKEFLQKRAVANFSAADANYGKMIQQKLVKLAAQQKRAAAPRGTAAAPLNPPRSVEKSHL